ncbi:NADH dehydrogenase subunit 4L (mitochondrion) [Mya arenaria]|uniref:NADH-ubiquinone oxidoreductase chain 4L n=1 Tax=Mya arenaria TaxID=6604 RepID=A0A076J9T8_MYAAR|nr:NADH dehydrogenase subunit 4L [Mya arenaria]AII72401.1 NADH dehydrogenase subunit 4L [Mya arenaria]UJM44279.1 NADH dehydrogenase subunit 4L [Mya arenaria]
MNHFKNNTKYVVYQQGGLNPKAIKNNIFKFKYNLIMEMALLMGWAVGVVVYSESFLGILICLEVFMLVMFLFVCFFFYVEMNSFGIFMAIIFLSMAVCEAVLGLALLVSSSRLCSSFSSHSFSLLKF